MNISHNIINPPRLLLLLFFFFGLRFGFEFGEAKRVPFRAKDVLPILPGRVSKSMLARLHSAADLLPKFVGAVVPNKGSVQWKGNCFNDNDAHVDFTSSDDTSSLGGGTLHLKVLHANSYTCTDLYIFATPYRITWDYYFFSGDHTLNFDSWESPAELEYVKKHGVSVFLMQSGMMGTLRSLADVIMLFSNSEAGQNANIDFIKKNMGAKFETRSQPWQAAINPADVNSGDFLAISKIRGHSGGFETLEKWVTGAFAGHTAVCLKDESGNLWVGESGHTNEKGDEIVDIIPWDKWWNVEVNNPANTHIALLPLHPEVREKFNSSAAWEYAGNMVGHPYGYHNMIFSWIDTASDNYPPPLDAHLVMSAMSMWTRVQPEGSPNLWIEALNKRLDTEDLDMYEILAEAEQRNISFDKLLTIPEQDEWVYKNGQSTTCVAFVVSMYKAAGIFGPLTHSVQATEFTVRDGYELNIYEDNQSRLPAWCNAGDNLPFCQILGEYKMELPGYNTLKPYATMNEKCPSKPPTYERPSSC